MFPSTHIHKSHMIDGLFLTNHGLKLGERESPIFITEPSNLTANPFKPWPPANDSKLTLTYVSQCQSVGKIGMIIELVMHSHTLQVTAMAPKHLFLSAWAKSGYVPKWGEMYGKTHRNLCHPSRVLWYVQGGHILWFPSIPPWGLVTGRLWP